MLQNSIILELTYILTAYEYCLRPTGRLSKRMHARGKIDGEKILKKMFFEI